MKKNDLNDIEKIEDIQLEFDKTSFKLKSKNSMNWQLESEVVFRAAEILAANAMDNWNKSNDREKNSKIGSHEMSIDEVIEKIDMAVIKPAFFLLSRAIELILKALIIKKDPNYFINNDQDKAINLSHELDDLIKITGIELPEIQKEYLNLLNDYPYIGTYPIPKNRKFLTDIREKKENARPIDLGIITYDDAALIYHILTENYFEKSIPNLYLKIPKQRKY